MQLTRNHVLSAAFRVLDVEARRHARNILRMLSIPQIVCDIFAALKYFTLHYEVFLPAAK